MNRKAPDYVTGDLFGEIYLSEVTANSSPRAKAGDYLPGIALGVTASLAAAFLAGQYGFPIILMGLLIGLALSFLADVKMTAPGLDFLSKRMLQAGIVLLGLQVTFAQVGALGWETFAGLLLVMAGAFCAAILAARLSGQSDAAGILAGGATAICGASAALALYAVIGKDRLDQARFSATLVGVAVASAIAMSVYPALAQLADLNDRQAGFLIGASVHDAAQAIGGAFAFSNEAGRDGTIVKLARVALLGPIVAAVALWVGAAHDGAARKRRVLLPWFITGFLALMILSSLVALPNDVREGALTVSKALLLAAVTATAMRSRLSELLNAGWLTFLPVAAATVTSFAIAFAFVIVL